LLEKEPPECEDAVPRLDSILTYAPAGLVRIVRKCVLADADQRYKTIKSLVADLDNYAKYDEVGVAHTEAQETNLTAEFPVKVQEAPAEHIPIPLKSRVSEAAEKPVIRSQKQYLSQRGLMIVGTVGFIIMVSCLVYGYVGSFGSLFGRIAMGIGAALATALIPMELQRENEARAGIAIAALALFFAWNPVSGIKKGGESVRMRSKDKAASVEAVKAALAGGGEPDLMNAQLKAANLSGLDFSKANLSFAGLSRANLQNCNFTGANFLEAWITGTDMTGAKMDGVRQFETAHCNNQTKMPAGWSCVSNRPAQGGAAPAASP